MATIYNFSRNVLQDIRQETKANYLFLPLLLVLISIPMRYAYGSIATGIFVGISLFAFKKEHFKIDKALLPSICVYLLMALSLFWTADFHETKSALFKVFPLLLVPACFFINKPFTETQIRKIMVYFAYAYVLFAVFYLGRALLRYCLTQDPSVFFYHELVTQDVNAVHVSVYMVLAYFSFMVNFPKSVLDKTAMALLALIVILLSSKNVIIVFVFLNLAYLFFFFNLKNKKGILIFIAGFGLLLAAAFFQKIKDRFEIEIASNINTKTINKDISEADALVYNVTVGEAWGKEKFNQNDFFPGTALRVYQLRIFLEMMQEDKVYLTGYGLNATHHKVQEKRIEHDLYEGYDAFNFHNQYIQFFAELGFFGFVLLLGMVIINFKKGLYYKDFTHISFAILMISLFLTESFLSRQRGIVFFIFFYCLFNAARTKAKAELT